MGKSKIDINEQHISMTSFLDKKNEYFNKKCHFFYDETNNHRRFWLKEDDFNASIASDFVLGGVLYFSDSSNANVSELKRLVRLQKNSQELKFKHLVKKGSTFLECLESNKIRIFLEWLNNTDLYIHYSNINNFYYAIVDIIDSVWDDNLEYNCELAKFMKNELYIFAIKHYNEFFTLLRKFNYPNIDDSEVSRFCEEIIDMISHECYDKFLLECLRQVLKSARKKNELIFLKDNKKDTIIDNYYMFYLRQIFMFKNATHVFDEEKEVEAEISKIELYDGNKLATNYSFVESKNSELVQVSDCVVGLIGKYHNYINQISIKEIESLNEILTEYQKNTLHLFSKLILRSENKCSYYLHSVESLYEHEKCAKILQWAISYKKN